MLFLGLLYLYQRLLVSHPSSSSTLAATASPHDEPPVVQIGRLQIENRCLIQTENCRLQKENDRLRSENRRFPTEKLGSPEMEEELANYGRLRPENCSFPLDEAFLIEMEEVAEKEAEILLGEIDANTKKEDADHHDQDQAVKPKKKEKEDEDDEADVGLPSENRGLETENARLKDAEKFASILQYQLEIVKASLGKEEEAAEKAIRERDDMREALELATAQCESLRLELDEKKMADEADEKFAQLVEARIARDEAVGKMEDCMAYNKYLEERFRKHERAVHVVRERALRLLERVKVMADDDDYAAGEAKAKENEEEADEKWIRVLMRPLEEEMEKIESSFCTKRRVHY